MLNFENFLNLPLIFAVIIAVAVLMYVLLDGFDLGVGILFPFAPSEDCRNKLINSIAPFWDGNETWLIMGGGGLFAVFPLAYSVILPALYIPILLMLLALIFRGVAFEFRFKATGADKKLWDMAFHFGSLLATFMQGMILGGIVQGIKIQDSAFAGGAFDWLSGFSFFTGLALVFGYALLGATWLYLKTEGDTFVFAERSTKYVLPFVVFFMAIVSIWVPFLEPRVFDIWFSMPNIIFLSIIPISVILCIFGIYKSLCKKNILLPYVLSALLFLLGYIGLGVSLWPYVVPYQITFAQAAAAPESLSLILVGVVFILPVILFYTGFCYYVFRGKVKSESMYHS